MGRRINGWALLAVYVLPPALIFLGLIPFKYRFVVLILVATAMTGVGLRVHGRRRLGLRRDNLAPSLYVNGAISAVLLVGLGLAPFVGLAYRAARPSMVWFYAFHVLVSAPAQEILYRSLVRAELDARAVANRGVRLAMLCVPYAFLHVVYRDPITVLITLCIGAVWAAVYDRIPNVWGVSLSHGVLGAVAFALGVV